MLPPVLKYFYFKRNITHAYNKDYTLANLTPWGYAEVQQDYLTLGGSKLHHLIRRAFPTWFKFNSVYCMQPMYTPAMNIEIAKQFKTLDQFSVDPPASPPKLTVLGTTAAVSLVVNDQKSFKVSHLNKVPDNVSADFMLCGDCSATQVNHTKLDARVKGCPGGLDSFSKCIESTMRKVLTREAYKLKDLYQVDMTKEYGFHCCSRAQADLLVSVARVAMLQTHADFLNLPLATKDNNRKGFPKQKCTNTWRRT
jgi:linoleate 10R-lipoxygenase